MPGTPVRILLARHGETEFNVEGRWQGQGNSPLTARGVAQARELGRALAHEHVSAVYSSDLGRALHTAEEVAALHGLRVRTEPRLREIDVGGWTGKGRAEIEAEYPGSLQAWDAAPASMRLPDGETLLEVQTRALAFFSQRMPAFTQRMPAFEQGISNFEQGVSNLEQGTPRFAQRVPAQAGQTIVVISHGAVGQTILVHAMGGTVADLWLERIDNCQISRLHWSAEEGLTLIELSDVRHLVEVGSLRGWRTDGT